MEAELVLAGCSEYVQQLYHQTPFTLGGRWLMIEVKDESNLDDVIHLIQTRVKPKVK